MRLRIAAAVLAATAAILGCVGKKASPKIVLDQDHGTIVVTGVRERDLRSLAVHSGALTDPPMLGSHQAQGDAIVFHPRFPLVPGLRYTVRVDAGGMVTEAVVVLPHASSAPSTVVSQVYPTAAELPANQLKFYLHFSAPMSRGDGFSHVRLLEEDGTAVQRPFLLMTEELWDANRQRFTLILDPGRIKRGLRSNVEDGAPLVAGHRYRLVVDAAWRDGEGNPLRQPFEKTFRVVAADRTAPDHHAWRLTAPTAGTTDPVQLTLNEPLDRALLEEMIAVLDEQGGRVEGGIEIGDGETQWNFRPLVPWRHARYTVHVSTKIEDRAGNNLQRLFDEDVTRAKPAETASSIELGFTPERRSRGAAKEGASFFRRSAAG